MQPTLQRNRRWLLFSITPLIACATCASLFAFAFASPPDVRPPYPSAELTRAETMWDLRGLHTVRVYHIPVTLQTTLEWYYGEGVVPRFARNNPSLRCADRRFNAPPPNLPFRALILSRFSQTHFCARDAYTEVITDTYYYWRYIEP